MQGLGPEHHVHEWRTALDGGAFLTGNAPAHADQQPRLAGLERPPPAQLVKDLLLSFFADGAGIQQDQIRVFRLGDELVPLALPQQIGHASRVVLVHLATVGFYVELLHRSARIPGARL